MLVTGAVVLAGVVAVIRWAPALRGPAGPGAAVAPLEVVTTSRDTVRLAELRGSVVLVNFWATWCAPCRVEMPAFQRVWEEYRDRGFVVVGLYTDEGPVSDLTRWFRDAGVAYPFARATPEARRELELKGVLPTSVLIGPDGRIHRRVEGIYREGALRSDLDALLGGR
jgi:thiol-disulfide isomerase/thioredoxin